MGTPYNGKPGQESRKADVAISSSTNATPIVLTTAAAHGLLEGDRVLVVNHETNTAANGRWYVHYVDATHVALYSAWAAGAVATASVGNGVGGATGTTTYLGLLPRATNPDDGVELRTATAINVPNEDAKNSQAWIAERIGARHLEQDFGQLVAQTPDTLTANASTAVGSWGYDTIGGLFGSAWVDVVDGDIVEITVTGTIVVSGANVKIALRPSYELADYGVAFAGTTTALGAGSQTYVTPAAGSAYFAVCLHSRAVVSVGARGKKLKPCVDNYGITAGPPTYGWYGDVQFHVRVWRSNA